MASPIWTPVGGLSVTGPIDSSSVLISHGTQGYAQVIANQAGITSAVDLTGLTLTLTTLTHRFRISAEVVFYSSVAGDNVALYINEDGGVVQSIYGIAAVATTSVTLSGSVIRTPSAASHTWKLQLARVAGTGTVVMQATASAIAYILIEDIGQ